MEYNSNLKQRSILTVIDTLSEDERSNLIREILTRSDVFVYDGTASREGTTRYFRFAKNLIRQLSLDRPIIKRSFIDSCYEIYSSIIEQSRVVATCSVNPPRYYFYKDTKMLGQFTDLIPMDGDRKIWFDKTVDSNYHNILLQVEMDSVWQYVSLLHLFGIVVENPKSASDILSSAGYN